MIDARFFVYTFVHKNNRMKTNPTLRGIMAIALMFAISFSAGAQARNKDMPVQQQTKQLQVSIDTLRFNLTEMTNRLNVDVSRISRIDRSILSRLNQFSGSGTSARPYKISNAAELKLLADLVNTGTAPYCNADVYYEQTADINLSGVEHSPIGTIINSNHFRGNYNGAGFTIFNLTIASNNDGEGLFGYTASSAVVRNVRMTNVTISAKVCTGSLVALNTGTIEYCYVNLGGGITGSNTIFWTGVGGMVGYNSGTVKNSIVAGNGRVTGYEVVGGLAGSNTGTIENCYTTVQVTGLHRLTGGIAGFSTGWIRFCYATGNVAITGISAESEYVGGIAGSSKYIDAYHGFTKNCVALNKSVTIASSSNQIGRVKSYSSGSNNYARADMVLRNKNGNVTPSTGTSTKDGGDVSAESYNVSNSPRRPWWEMVAKFSTQQWSIGNNRLPHLRGFPGLTQNPVVTP